MEAEVVLVDSRSASSGRLETLKKHLISSAGSDTSHKSVLSKKIKMVIKKLKEMHQIHRVLWWHCHSHSYSQFLGNRTCSKSCDVFLVTVGSTGGQVLSLYTRTVLWCDAAMRPAPAAALNLGLKRCSCIHADLMCHSRVESRLVRPNQRQCESLHQRFQSWQFFKIFSDRFFVI